ncbi:PEP-CTERM motif protein [Planctomycetes bacterium CA13]|uniref:PEP-CTERM motif protein n=1 Tax=Novipirellula herctigrandis TaxID=2527986 RepID=A0A5C5YMN1_9BACT|nr:PEP-CTERM motif protein [Planctomycetes bacterium CA13]
MNKFLVILAFYAALGASALNAQSIVLSMSMDDPNAIVDIELGEGAASSLYLWVDPLADQKIVGMGIDITSSQPSVLEATTHTILNPSFFGGAFNRWDGSNAGSLGDLVSGSNAVAVTGLGIADANTGFGDVSVSGFFLHSQIDFLATAIGSSTVGISANIFGVSDSDGLVTPSFTGGTVNVVAVPEPSSVAVLAMGLVGLVVGRRRRA